MSRKAPSARVAILPEPERQCSLSKPFPDCWMKRPKTRTALRRAFFTFASALRKLNTENPAQPPCSLICREDLNTSQTNHESSQRRSNTAVSPSTTRAVVRQIQSRLSTNCCVPEVALRCRRVPDVRIPDVPCDGCVGATRPVTDHGSRGS